MRDEKRFQVVRPLGADASSLLARDTSAIPPRLVVLEKLGRDGGPEAHTRMVRRARALVALEHPKVVGVREVIERDGDVFVVSEYIDGEWLTAVLEAEPRAPVEVLLRLVVDVLEGLGALHELPDERGQPQRIVHGALAPDSILVAEDGVAEIARACASSARRLEHYVAPEVRRGELAVDVRADVYSVGALLREVLAAAPAEAKWAEQLTDVAARACSFEPEERFPSAAAMAAAVRRLAASHIASASDVAAYMRKTFGARIRARRAALSAIDDAPPSSGQPISVRSGDVMIIEPSSPALAAAAAATPAPPPPARPAPAPPSAGRPGPVSLARPMPPPRPPVKSPVKAPAPAPAPASVKLPAPTDEFEPPPSSKSGLTTMDLDEEGPADTQVVANPFADLPPPTRKPSLPPPDIIPDVDPEPTAPLRPSEPGPAAAPPDAYRRQLPTFQTIVEAPPPPRSVAVQLAAIAAIVVTTFTAGWFVGRESGRADVPPAPACPPVAACPPAPPALPARTASPAAPAATEAASASASASASGSASASAPASTAPAAATSTGAAAATGAANPAPAQTAAAAAPRPRPDPAAAPAAPTAPKPAPAPGYVPGEL